MSTLVKPLTTLGLMSGTSMDGVDAAIITSNGENTVEVLATHCMTYPAPFQQLLKAAEFALRQTEGKLARAQQQFQTYLSEFARQLGVTHVRHWQQCLGLAPQEPILFATIIAKLTDYHIEASQACWQQVSSLPLDGIGFHGQTLYHNAAAGVSLQLGDSQRLAQCLGVPVVAQFRQQDIAQGGQGAPLAPIYHLALAVRDQRLPAVVVNCGGITNVSLLPNADPMQMLAFDCGPGNVLLDRLVRARTQGECAYDIDGQFALAGRIHEEYFPLLLTQSCRQAGAEGHFYQRLPPKSLDTHDLICPKIIETLSLPDACATLAAFTAYSLVESIKTITVKQHFRDCILCGGGFYHPVIKKQLAYYLQQAGLVHWRLKMAAELGWDEPSLEAQLMAYLAIRHRKGLPVTFPNTTGARVASVGGELVACTKDTASKV